jgi:outer membrane lipoprotein carrier protein
MSRMVLGFFSALVLCYGFIPAVFAITGQEVLAEIQTRYEKTNDLEARFVQEYVGKVMRSSQSGQGQVYFKKKGMMRWDYRVPLQQLITNGKTLWNYQPEEKQVFVSEISMVIQEKTPLAFLAGEGDLNRDFKIGNFNDVVSPKEENYVIELLPREPNAALAKLVLSVDKKTFLVTQVDVMDGLGNVTRTRFIDIKTDVALSATLFNFVIPSDTEVLKFQEPAAPAPPVKGPTKK